MERHTTGVIGALELSPPGTDILPHEHTTKKAKSDRLDLLRSCRANLSAIWGLSLAKGLTDLLPVARAAARRRRRRGRRAPHRVAGRRPRRPCAAISAAVAEQPVVVADGHHRYETSLAYKAEREAADGDAGRGRRHPRLPRGAGRGRAHRARHPPAALRPARRTSTSSPPSRRGSRTPGRPPPTDRSPPRWPTPGCLTLVLPDREVLLRPRPDALGRRARPRLEPPRRRPRRAPRPRAPLPARRRQRPRRGRRAATPRPACCSARSPSPRSRPPPTAASACRPKSTFFHPKPKTGLGVPQPAARRDGSPERLGG